MASKYELSRKVGAALADQIRAQPPGAVIVASGTSCRQQIEHLTPARPKHMAELLAECGELEAFRHWSENLYERVRALLFLYGQVLRQGGSGMKSPLDCL